MGYQSPLNNNSIFATQPECGDYVDDFYSGGIDYELLAKDIYEKTNKSTAFFFNYERYKIASSFQTVDGVNYKNTQRYKNFSYIYDDTAQEGRFEQGKLNLRKCYLSNSYTYGIYLTSSGIEYVLNFPFLDAENKRYSDEETRNSSELDFKQLDQYKAIRLSTTDVKVFLGFLNKSKGKYASDSMKVNTNRYFKRFFTDARNDPDKLDVIYQHAPSFVIEQIEDSKLWKDFVILSEGGINRIGSNENVSILNLLNGIKSKNWWYQQINMNPEPVRRIFQEFSSDYISDLIICFAGMGYGVWKNEQLKNAWEFNLEFKEFYYRMEESEKVDINAPYIRYTGFARFNENEKKYTVGTVMFLYENRMALIGIGKEIGTQKLELPFTPLKIVIEDKIFHIPAFVGEYFTEKKIDEGWWTALHNVAGLLMPEFNLAQTRALFIASKINNGKLIKTIDELIEFLENVDQNISAVDLQKVGIKVLFRGTTRSRSGNLFAGNPNSVVYGASTSTDPIRAIIFALESGTRNNEQGVVQVFLTKDLKGLNMQLPNRRIALELEAIVNTSPENLAKFAVKEIPVEELLPLLEKNYGVKIDTRISIRAKADELLDQTLKLTPKQAEEFYNKIKK